MKGSLFGHLALNFSASPENLATEAFCFILNRSETAKMAFVRFVSQVNPSLPSTLRFETQIHTPGNSSEEDTNLSSDSRPDFAGRDDTNTPVVLGEVKFWAGLTDNQPVIYLKKYPESSILLFVAPSKRLPLLWNELIRRCKEAGLVFQQTTIIDDEFKFTTIDKHPMLVLTSWRKVLNSIQHAVESEGETDTLSDILQLQGLCNRMDETAFLPVRSDELTSNIGKRINQFCDLVDAVTDQLANDGMINLKGLRATPQRTGYARYMAIGNYGCSFQVNHVRWSNFRETPLWFIVHDWSSAKAKEAKPKLAKLEMEDPSRLIQDGNELVIPIFIPIGVEKADVVKSLIRQIQEVIDMLAIIDE